VSSAPDAHHRGDFPVGNYNVMLELNNAFKDLKFIEKAYQIFWILQ
jgi:hypothetical protein